MSSLSFRVEGLRGQGLEFRGCKLGLGVRVCGFRVQGSGLSWGLGFQGFGFRAQGGGFRV